jgi:hypothetical protein
MRKNLRFILFSMLAVVASAAYAERTVTLDFDNDYQQLFPTLAGVSSGSDVHDGDFTEMTMSSNVDGVMVMVSPEEDAKTPSRIWSASPRLRMYSGAFIVTSTAEVITKIEFTGHNTNFNLVPNDGTLEGKTWTGSSSYVIFAVTKNTQISSIVVTLGEGGQVTPGPGDDDEPSSILDDFKITSGQITDNGDQLLFDFVATSQSFGSEMKGRLDFAFENNICTSCVMTVNFPNAETATAAYQQMLEENEEGQAEVSVNGNVLTVVAKDEFIGFSKIVIKSMFKMTISPEDANGYGILDNPFTACMANVLAGSLEQGETTTEDYYVKGKIADIKYTFSEQYGTATFFISRDGSNDYTFQAYSVYYLENKPWVEGNTQIKVGDEVIICGKLTNYNGTPETASKKAYIYSLNGVTKNEMGEKPEEIKSVTIAEFNAAAESSSVWYQLTGIVNNLKDNDMYGNFDLEDETGSVYVYGVLSEKGGAKRLFQELVAAKGIQNGSKLTIIGNRGSYNGKIEVTNAYFVSVDNSDAGISNSIATTETKAVVYNLRGQRVDAAYKGIVIKNGRKQVQK